MPTPLNWKMLGEVTIETSSQDFTLAETGVNLGLGVGVAKPMTMALGRYSDVRVLANDDAATGNDLQRILTAAGGQAYTVSVNDIDGLVSITAGGGNNFAIVWTDVALRNIFGFTINLAGATGYTSVNAHKYRFAADRALWWRRVNDTELDEAVTVSHDGGMTARRFFESVLGVMEYRFVVSDEQTELWTFWQDIMRNRKAFNLYPDRANNTVYDHTSNDEGYRRWKLHESVKGWEPSYPQRPYAVHRHVIWPLRQDPRDSEFIAIGT